LILTPKYPQDEIRAFQRRRITPLFIRELFLIVRAFVAGILPVIVSRLAADVAH
jgi:hypothetical protein